MTNTIEPHEGRCPFSTPITQKPCYLWYRTVGDFTTAATPVVILHGGPGMTHDYLLSLEDLACGPYNLPLVFWDQLGCGRSTLLPETAGRPDVWSEDVFLNQLDCLLRYLQIDQCYSVLGHSWGGMLAAAHAARRPQGLQKLVLASTPFSAKHYTDAYCRYREEMPSPYREELLESRADDATIDTPEYLEAMDAFNRRHFLTLQPVPEDVQRSYDFAKKDNTVSMSALGQDEFEYTGWLAPWTISGRAREISVPTLLSNGVGDGADDDSMREFLSELIQGTQWHKFRKSSHMAHLEERVEFMRVVGSFLRS